MTNFRIDPFPFEADSVRTWAALEPRHTNWPVVYTLDGSNEIYVGETINGAGRLKQHLDSGSKKQLGQARVIVADTFNKSACLDLESYLIRLFAGDGQYQVINRNEGITNADYYGRDGYQQTFDEIFQELRRAGLFTRSIRAIENTDLFKLSPFKALTPDQAIAVEDILSGLFDDLATDRASRIVIQGDPGTGKTVVAIFLMKLLADIQHSDGSEPNDGDSLLSEFFVEGYPELLEGFRVGLVVPQQSLRKSIQRVFKRTPGLDPRNVLTPFQVGESDERFDLLIVDETHRLTRKANQTSASLNRKFADITTRLFGEDESGRTQLDWINAQSNHQIYLLDAAQSVRPMDVSPQSLEDLIAKTDFQHRRYRLTSQMRVKASQDYVGYVRRVLAHEQDEPEVFDGYDLRFYDDFGSMHEAIRERESETGLARLLAGYAWPWASKRDKTASDIEIDGVKLRWNQVAVDWVNSPGSSDEVGSIHTIQGYDLNYAGVVIGPDLTLDPVSGQMRVDRSSYFDKKGKQNNPGETLADDDLLGLIRNIYAVLLTRGMLGTYVYVCDPELRQALRRFFT